MLGKACGLDPLDPLVVDAYWVGNDLLGRVDPEHLLTALRQRFRGQSGGLLTTVEPSEHVLANHGFHVFAVYPWTRMLGGSSDVPRSVLDSCRIRWGTVVGVDGETGRGGVSAADLGRAPARARRPADGVRPVVR